MHKKEFKINDISIHGLLNREDASIKVDSIKNASHNQMTQKDSENLLEQVRNEDSLLLKLNITADGTIDEYQSMFENSGLINQLEIKKSEHSGQIEINGEIYAYLTKFSPIKTCLNPGCGQDLDYPIWKIDSELIKKLNMSGHREHVFTKIACKHCNQEYNARLQLDNHSDVVLLDLKASNIE